MKVRRTLAIACDHAHTVSNLPVTLPGAVALSKTCPLGMHAAPRPAHSFVETWS